MCRNQWFANNLPTTTVKALPWQIDLLSTTSFETFGLKEAYKRVQKSGDRLSEFETLIEWDAFRPILDVLYNNKTSQGGRPNIDPIVMLKLLVLQSLYNLLDPELERQVADRISFRKFIGFSTEVPDFSTVW
jgi:transposase, IS5 family